MLFDQTQCGIKFVGLDVTCRLCLKADEFVAELRIADQAAPKRLPPSSKRFGLLGIQPPEQLGTIGQRRGSPASFGPAPGRVLGELGPLRGLRDARVAVEGLE